MSLRLILAAILWAAAAGASFGYLAVHASTPSRQANAPAEWPATSTLPRLPGRSSLVVLLHPACPCSRATVAELARLRPRLGTDIDVHVLFVVPTGLAVVPERSALWSDVTSIPGVTAHVDPAGIVASRFGAFTSGQVLLYDARGALRFAGGLTASRGHEGRSAGADALEAAVHGVASPARAPVFGCSLFGETS